MDQETLDPSANISWAAYHASNLDDHDFQSCISALLPLFTEEAKSPSMIRHVMDLVKKAVLHLNPGQVPVLTLDQPLYTVAKQLQWTWPDRYGESQFIIILGGLHIEMCTLKCIGDWLNGSGWTNALVQSDIVSPGKADSLV